VQRKTWGAALAIIKRMTLIMDLRPKVCYRVKPMLSAVSSIQMCWCESGRDRGSNNEE